MADRAYHVRTIVPTGGKMTATQLGDLLEGMREQWDRWLERVTKNGPTDTDAQQALLRGGVEIESWERIRQHYFQYADSGTPSPSVVPRKETPQ